MNENSDSSRKLRLAARSFLVIFYGLAGALHIWLPNPFLSIMPKFIPFPAAIVFLTGLSEIAGAAGLLTGRFRKCGGYCLALYAICVYPANIQHAINDLSHGTGLGWWYHGPRLALQPVIVWLPLFAVGAASDLTRVFKKTKSF